MQNKYLGKESHSVEIILLEGPLLLFLFIHLNVNCQKIYRYQEILFPGFGLSKMMHFESGQVMRPKSF